MCQVKTHPRFFLKWLFLPVSNKFYRPQQYLLKGKVFIGMRHSFCPRVEGRDWRVADTCPKQTPPRQTLTPGQTPRGQTPPPPADTYPWPDTLPPNRDTPGQTPPKETATEAGGTHPTGMHSC